MLTSLLRKDFRICRLPLVAGIVLLLGPYALSMCLIMNMPLWSEATPASAWATLLGTGAYFSLMCSQATIAMLSGSIIATERADRSAEFLAYLPPSKAMILGSKFLVLMTILFIIWGGNLSIGLVANSLAGNTDAAEMMTSNLAPISSFASIGILFLGAGWCASAMLSNTGPAVAFSFLAPLVVLAALRLLQYLFQHPSVSHFPRTYFSSCTVFGLTLFIFGTIHFLRRKQP